jgi:hypothetical protein
MRTGLILDRQHGDVVLERVRHPGVLASDVADTLVLVPILRKQSDFPARSDRLAYSRIGQRFVDDIVKEGVVPGRGQSDRWWHGTAAVREDDMATDIEEEAFVRLVCAGQTARFGECIDADVGGVPLSHSISRATQSLLRRQRAGSIAWLRPIRWDRSR